MIHRWILVALIAVGLVGGGTGLASGASAGQVGADFTSCPGKVGTAGDSYAHRIRVDGMGCARAKEAIRDTPEHHGFACKFQERLRGILAICKRPRHDPTVRLRYLETAP